MEEQVLVERVVSAINLCNGRQAHHLFKWHHAYLPWALYIYIVKWLDYGITFASFVPHHSKYSGASGKRMEYSRQRIDKEGGP